MCCYTPYGSKEMWEGAHPPIILWFSKYSFFNTTGQWCFIILFLIQLPGMSEKPSPAKLYTKAIQETLQDFLYIKGRHKFSHSSLPVLINYSLLFTFSLLLFHLPVSPLPSPLPSFHLSEG